MMRFVTTRQLRLRPQETWKQLSQEGELILTSRGRPVALLAGLPEGDPEEMVRFFRRFRAQLALSRIREAARQKGLDRLTPEQIEAEIQAVRRSRRA